MRKLALIFAGLAVITFSTGSHCNEMTSPSSNLATPVVTHIEPNPTHAASVLIFQGTEFDATGTFTLQQDGVVKTTLANPLFATGTAKGGIQIDVTIPAGTAVGSYRGCVTTPGGIGCAATPVEVF